MSLWTPKFLRNDAFGLDISDRSFKYAELKKAYGIVDVKVFGKGLFPEGAIVGGEIKDIDAAARALAETIRAAHLSTNKIIMALPEEKGFLRKIDIPADTPEEQTRSFLELHLEEHIPLAAEDILFDYEHMAPRTVIVTAFPRTVVERYIELAQKAGFEPIIFETEMHALARVAIPHKKEEHTVMAIDIGEMRAGIVIAEKGVVAFTSTKLLGGDTMIEAIKQATASSKEEATRLFFEEGLNPEKKEVLGALLPIVSTLRGEILQHIDFWQTHYQSKPDHIYLTGGAAHLEGLPEYLSYELGIPVARAAADLNLFDLQKSIPIINRHDALLWAIALGLAVRALSYD
ncbi:MAG: pilus assembly protein PilM [Patescibacteria group bacterium]